MEKALPWIALALALGLGLGWLLIHSLVKSGAMAPKAGNAVFCIAVGALAFDCVLVVLYCTVLDPERDILFFVGIVSVAALCIFAPLAMSVGKMNREGLAQIEEQRNSNPSFTPTPEEAKKQAKSRKRWTVVLYVITGLYVLYRLIRAFANA